MNLKQRQLEALRRKPVRLFSPQLQEILERSDQWSRRFNAFMKWSQRLAMTFAVTLVITCLNWDRRHELAWGDAPGVIMQALVAWAALYKLSEGKSDENRHGRNYS